jgi:hypothetical protein
VKCIKEEATTYVVIKCEDMTNKELAETENIVDLYTSKESHRMVIRHEGYAKFSESSRTCVVFYDDGETETFRLVRGGEGLWKILGHCHERWGGGQNFKIYIAPVHARVMAP